MIGLTRRLDYGYSGHLFVFQILLSSLALSTVQCSCPTVTELLAYNTPSDYQMNDTRISSDRGAKCTWLIKASNKNEVVVLSFTQYYLRNSTKSKTGDSLYIYDGEGDDAKMLDEIYDKLPRNYNSTQHVLRVVYKRGEVQGDRNFTMTFASEKRSKEEASYENIIRMAGIVGGSLAGFGLTIVILKATKCCSCFLSKNTDSHTRINSLRETARLTTVNCEETEDGGRAVNGGGGTSQGQATQVDTPGEATSGQPDGSESDSLPDVNEPPPSYESLYLNELGEPITPPNYSPPKHRSTHPPRRVHTIN